MSYRFEAEPKVVLNRAKYRTVESDGLGSSGRSGPIVIKATPQTPAQQESEYIRVEKDRIKLENMHKQLVAFKQSKKKISPYDIRPSANPKVPANLEFFLTDSTDIKPPQTNIDVQTDTFRERPKSPPYVPKKTGRDVSTQVEDNELFNFDREVTPIVDVISTKTVEQALIEIEEEEEIFRIKTFKEAFWRRRQEDEEKCKAMLMRELEIIAVKNKKLDEFRLREERRINLLRKVQTYHFAKTYLRDVAFNSLSHVFNNGLYQNDPREELINNLPPFFIDGISKILTKRHNIRDQVAQAFTQIEGEIMARREAPDSRYKKKQEKKRVRRINQSKDERLVRFMYADDTTPSSYFVRFISKLQEPELKAYFEDYNSRVEQLKEKFSNSELNEEEYNTAYASEFPEIQIPNNLRIVLNDFQKLSFNVANNMYYSELVQDGYFNVAISAYSKEGKYLYQVDKNSPVNESQSIKYLGNVRDEKVKISDDLGMKINLRKIEPEVTQLVLTVEIQNLDQSIALFNDFLQHSRFRLADYITNQTVEETEIFPNFKLEELKDSGAESELGGKIICYTIYRAQGFGWVFESVKSFANVPINTAHEFNDKVANYLQVCMDEQTRESPDYDGSAPNSGPASAQQSFDKGKLPSMKSTDKLVPLKPDEPQKEEEQSYSAKFTSTTFGPIALKITDTVESIQQQVEELLETKNPVLFKSFEYGYEILVAENELVRPTQIRKIGPVTSFLIKRKPKPYEEPVVAEDEDGSGEEGEEGDEDEEQADDE